MSTMVELEWELYDIFDTGTFAFPIYDHNSARQIVQYLLMRGILGEEIAEAIEDSTADLAIWMASGGKHKIGEWVIAWINDLREEFDRGEFHKIGLDDRDMDNRELDVSSTVKPKGAHGNSDDDDDDNVGELGTTRQLDGHASIITERDSIISQNVSRASVDTLDSPDCDMQIELPLAQTTHVHSSAHPIRHSRPDELDVGQTVLRMDETRNSPDSGHFSSIYASISPRSIKASDTSVYTECHKPDAHLMHRDTPGYIYIMTDSIANCIPWSCAHMYKITSSLQSEPDTDLIWRVKVKQKDKAIDQINDMLKSYNLHSTWFKCSLTVIMDTVSRVVRHRK